RGTFSSGHRGAVRGVRSAALRCRDHHRRSPPRSRARTLGPHRCARARIRDVDRSVAHITRRPRAEEKSAVDVNNRIAVVGAGLIGRSWAVVFAGGGCEVALYDAAHEVAENARMLVMQGLEDLAEQELLKDAPAAPRACASPAISAMRSMARFLC